MLRAAGYVLVFTPLLASCAHVGLLPTQNERSVANETFQYAQLSLNAYDKSRDKFVLTPDVTLVALKPNDEIGLAYTIFTRQRPNQPIEHVIAFRGTEGGVNLSSCDFRYGNRRLLQQGRAIGIVRDYIRTNGLSPARDDLVLTGHSLGGAIAIHVSLQLDLQGYRVYAFDTSPRFKEPPNYDRDRDPTRRMSIYEQGEILRIVRAPAIEAKEFKMPLNCLRAGGLIEQHSMRALAVCLTRMAAAESNSLEGAGRARGALLARQSIDLNGWAFGATDTSEEPTHDTCVPPRD